MFLIRLSRFFVLPLYGALPLHYLLASYNFKPQQFSQQNDKSFHFIYNQLPGKTLYFQSCGLFIRFIYIYIVWRLHQVVSCWYFSNVLVEKNRIKTCLLIHFTNLHQTICFTVQPLVRAQPELRIFDIIVNYILQIITTVNQSFTLVQLVIFPAHCFAIIPSVHRRLIVFVLFLCQH